MRASRAGYRIGQLARITGLTADTLRYYEHRGLLERPGRSPGGFRIYRPATVERLEFIKRARALGFTLDEIHELIGFNGRGGLSRCTRVRDLLADHLRQLDVTLADLTVLRETLQAAFAQCEHAIDTKNASACPVIELKPE